MSNVDLRRKGRRFEAYWYLLAHREPMHQGELARYFHMPTRSVWRLGDDNLFDVDHSEGERASPNWSAKHGPFTSYVASKYRSIARKTHVEDDFERWLRREYLNLVHANEHVYERMWSIDLHLDLIANLMSNASLIEPALRELQKRDHLSEEKAIQRFRDEPLIERDELMPSASRALNVMNVDLNEIDVEDEKLVEMITKTRAELERVAQEIDRAGREAMLFAATRFSKDFRAHVIRSRPTVLITHGVMLFFLTRLEEMLKKLG